MSPKEAGLDRIGDDVVFIDQSAHFDFKLNLFLKATFDFTPYRLCLRCLLSNNLDYDICNISFIRS